ncbi:KR domain-containing protein [Streptomyces lasalocidi]
MRPRRQARRCWTTSPRTAAWTCSSPTPPSPLGIGNPGQSAYAAANAYLEALVRARHNMGKPGTALAWGPIGQTGYVARNAMETAMTERGLELLTPAEALTTAGLLMVAAEPTSPEPAATGGAPYATWCLP